MASRKKRKRVTYVQEIDIKYYLNTEGREAAASIPLFMQYTCVSFLGILVNPNINNGNYIDFFFLHHLYHRKF